MTPLRQRMLHELQRRNYSPSTIRGYLGAVRQFAEHFHCSPEQLGAEHLRRYQRYLLQEKKLEPSTVEMRVSALRFLYKRTLKRRDLAFDDLIFPKVPHKLPTVLSQDEVVRLGAASIRAISYNSCRNRHCPKCQTGARDQWLANRQQELLTVGYYHLVFSVPHALVPLMWQNKRSLFSLLFEASAATLLDIAADPKHLGAGIGFLSILHTWGQTLTPHPHIHCVVPGGGLAPDHSRWIASRSRFLLPVKVLSRVFRGKFVAGLRRLFARDPLRFFGECMSLHKEKHFALFLHTLYRQDWVVYAKPPFGGPEHVLHYLARYTHRVTISNHRLLSVSATEVCFRWKDYAHHSKQRTMTLAADEFLRRFVQHVLPRGFPRIRYFGFLANRRRTRMLPLCRVLLHQAPPTETLFLAKPTLGKCPHCHGPMYLVERLSAAQLFFAERKEVYLLDSS